MKSEELNQACPVCGCKDKTVSQTKKKTSVDTCYIPHIPDGNVGVILCSECGHVFEYCKDRKLKQEVKKIEF
jgi:Cys-rich peptide (TIGR04165 family)|nr:TIGR04165 family Cys-rich peptide [uncultured Methanobacterium sp.]